MNISVNDKKTVHNYPYGTLQCTASFSLEFNPKKGFRSVFQTINPKTGRINNPKKGTYNDIMYINDDNGYITFKSKELYKAEDFNEVTKFLAENYLLYTPEQIKYIYLKIISYIRMTVTTMKLYCNADIDKSSSVVENALKMAVEGYKNPEKNLFENIKIDHEKLEALKDPNYQPFKVTSYGI